MNYIIRAARPADLQSLYEMAKLTGGGFTNLPADRKALTEKLERSARAFQRSNGGDTGSDRTGGSDSTGDSDSSTLGDDFFLLMLEDLDCGEVRGTCQIFSQIGQHWPFYSYRIGTVSQHSQELNRIFSADTLNLCNDLNGASEVGGLFLHPHARASGLGMLLARSRYLFIARHRARFAERIIAELRGVIDEAGGSPFWDGLAGKFFGMSFQEADQFSAVHGNQFIADLMPKHPIYIAMLPEHVRSVIARPHPNGRAAMRMLENEGFSFENYIDIFDGGPTMTARTDQVMSIANTRSATIGEINASRNKEQNEKQNNALVAHGYLANFRCCYGRVEQKSGKVSLDANSAARLSLTENDTLYWVAR